MKKIKLSKEEKVIEQQIENNEYIPITGEELKEVAAAVAARKKDSTITIRVNTYDIKRIRQRAKKLGIKYQSYISDVLHKVAQNC
jgi:predicted DNA binding CopG/RHH family protein